jgi:hypothetical protein
MYRILKPIRQIIPSGKDCHWRPTTESAARSSDFMIGLLSKLQSPSWKGDSHSAGQDPWPLRNHLVYYRVHKTFHFTLSWVTWIQSTSIQTVSLRFVLILHFHLSLYGLFPSYISNNILYEFLISCLRHTCPDHVIVTIILFSEEYKLWSSFLFIFF